MLSVLVNLFAQCCSSPRACTRAAFYQTKQSTNTIMSPTTEVVKVEVLEADNSVISMYQG